MGEVSDAHQSYLRFPHLHGDLLTFVAEDDVWVAPLGPGRAWRLTADRTRAGHPRFSPDGASIAFTGWRSLDPELYLAPVDGGPAPRLTYWGSPDARVRSWSPDGRILAVSSHGQPFSHYAHAYSVPTDGGPGERLPWGPAADIAVHHDAAGRRRTLLLTGTPPHEPHAWKRYRGGATGRLWLSDEGSGSGGWARLVPEVEGHLEAPMFVGGRIAFLSDHEGIGNLYSCLPDGTDLRRHTDHADFYARAAATDGDRVVYQCAGEVWLLDGLTGSATGPRRLDVHLGGPRTGRRPYQVQAASGLDSLACDLTGRASAVCVRGSLYWLTHRDGPARTIADAPGTRVRLPKMLGTTGRIAFVTDAEGEDAIEIADLPGRHVPMTAALKEAGTPADPARPAPSAGTGSDPAAAGLAAQRRPPCGSGGRRLAAGELGRVHELVCSPDGGTLAVAANDGRLLMVNTDPDRAGTVTELVHSINGPVRDLSFSPDSAWIAWSHPWIGRSLRQIRIARLADRTVIDVTGGRFEDEQPVFTDDGRYLAFLSWRGFDPVYDVHTGDLSFPLGCRPYLVPLNSATASPFALPVEGRPAVGGLDAEGTGDGPVVVEAEGLPSRVTPFPVPASKYSSLEPVRGGLAWLRWPIAGALGETFTDPTDPSSRPSLEYFDLAKSKKRELIHHMDWYAVSGDGSRLVVLDDGDLTVVPATEPGDADSTVYVDLRRVPHQADPAAEWRQSYEEAGRIVRDYFWAPDMCGVDWDAVLDQYRPLVQRVASPDEFADLLREVLGELGTSHAYAAPARRNEGPAHYQRPTGLLGANFTRTREGAWIVRRILPGESSDSKARSPLAGTGIREGAVLTHVDGRRVDPVAGPYPLLAGSGGTTVELTFGAPECEGAPDPAGPSDPAPRRVAVVPLIDERPLRYQDWVAKRRALVRELSGDRCGYLHIPDMGGSGWAQFNRDVRMEVTYEALIVDVRGNAGGNISELVIEKLTRAILGWDHTRNAQPVSYLSDAPRGPVVALADEATSSDGDMIAAAFKLLGLGPVVGSRTWGGVVGMTGRHRLGDGSVITVPMNAAWFDAYGWDIENHGVVPDIASLRTPSDWAQGRNTQLAAAVRTALDLLEQYPSSTPPDLSDRPDRRRPQLPPRR